MGFQDSSVEDVLAAERPTHTEHSEKYRPYKLFPKIMADVNQTDPFGLRLFVFFHKEANTKVWQDRPLFDLDDQDEDDEEDDEDMDEDEEDEEEDDDEDDGDMVQYEENDKHEDAESEGGAGSN